MRRRLFNFGTVLSLLLCAVVCVLWARSPMPEGFKVQWVQSAAGDERRSRILGVESGSGTLVIWFDSEHYGPGYGAGWLSPKQLDEFRANFPVGFHYSRQSYLPSPLAKGFRAWRWVGTNRRGGREEQWTLACPHWVPVLILLMLPAVWLIQRRKANRARRLNLCATCGYDLRASPDRCPECGAPPGVPPHNPAMQRTDAASSGAVE
jgi:hypothetical protein